MRRIITVSILLVSFYTQAMEQNYKALFRCASARTLGQSRKKTILLDSSLDLLAPYFEDSCRSSDDESLESLFSLTKAAHRAGLASYSEKFQASLRDHLNNKITITNPEENKKTAAILEKNLDSIQSLIQDSLYAINQSIVTESIVQELTKLNVEQTLFLFYLLEEPQENKGIIFSRNNLKNSYESLDPALQKLIKNYVLKVPTKSKRISLLVKVLKSKFINSQSKAIKIVKK